MKKIIIDTEKFIIEYCKINRFDIIVKYILNINYYDFENDDTILIFIIKYNNYNYEYRIKIDNKRVLFSINLKNNRFIQIVLNNKLDFDILVNEMIKDNKK